jgi:DNA/RNA non-specific endonuclease/Pretoxin HINT domain
MVRSAISQGIGVTLGLQDKFSWAAVAAAGIGSAVSQAVTSSAIGTLDEAGRAVGDWVYARDQHGHSDLVHQRQILETYQFEDMATLTVVINTASGPMPVDTTELHPFALLGDQGAILWTAAQDLLPGDTILTKDGSPATVAAIEPRAGLTTVYNFAVDQDHTYFIGDAGLWVHNVYGESGSQNRGRIEARVSDDGIRQASHEEREAMDDAFDYEMPGPPSLNNNIVSRVWSLRDRMPLGMPTRDWDAIREASPDRRINVEIGNSLRVMGAHGERIWLVDTNGDQPVTLSQVDLLSSSPQRGHVFRVRNMKYANNITPSDIPGNTFVVQTNSANARISWFDTGSISSGSAFARYWQNPRYNQFGDSQAFVVKAISGTCYRRTVATYTIGNFKRTTSVQGQLRVMDSTADRGLPRLTSSYWQRVARRSESWLDGWHLVGPRFGGAAELFNLVGFDRGLNRGSFNQFERGMATDIGRDRRDRFADYRVSVTYSGNSARAIDISASYQINGTGPRIRWNPTSRTGR